MNGSALGSCTLSKISQRVALMERMNSMIRRSVAFSPRVVLVTMGKNEMMAQIMILGAMPKPNQIVSSGMTAMMGMAFDTMTYGNTPRSRKHESPIPAKRAIPPSAE